MHPQSAYDELIRRCREDALLTSAITLLGWDEETYMPKGGAAHRAELLAHLSGLEHDRATDPRLAELLGLLADSDLARNADSLAAANIRELRRLYDRQTRLPRTSPAERSTDQINRRIQQDQRILGVEQDVQSKSNQIRQNVDRDRLFAPRYLPPMPRSGCGPGRVC